jgi:myo-inositol 2-dehydrogenase/D-chiro-inositol 1-dehydrogenase
VKLIAVCDLDIDRAKAAADILGASKTYEDYNNLMADDDIEAVLITNTTSEHCNTILAGAKNKKHMYCEKPTGVSLEELDKIDNALKSIPEKVFQVGLMRRFDSAYIEAKEKIDCGMIGKVIKIRSVTRDPACQYEDYLRFGPGSGGMFFDMCVHDFDLVRWFADSEIKSVYAIGGIYDFFEFERFNDIDNASVLMEFQNNVMAEVEGCKNATCGYDVWMEVVGTKGSIRIGPMMTNPVILADSYGVRSDCMPWFKERFAAAYRNEILDFIDCVAHNKRSKVGANDARKAVELAFLAQESLNQKNIVRV